MPHLKIQQRFKAGDRVIDRDGFHGVVTGITYYNGSHWYDVRFDAGTAVRYESDLLPNE